MFLTFKNVTFIHEYSADPILKDLCFTVGEGWTGVIGANGSGKTTLLRLALRELSPTEGNVLAPRAGLLCPQRTDTVPDSLAELLVRGDLGTHRLVQILGLQPDWASRWDTLSHGERKRAQLATILDQDPDFLAVDEPTNHLDSASCDRVREALATFRGLGLLVSHDRDLLDRLCDRCLFLEASGLTLRPGGYSEGARQEEQERTAMLRRRAKASHEVERLEREMQARRVQATKAEHNRSKRGIPKGDHDAKSKVNAMRVADSGSGQRLRQLEGRLEQASDQKAGLVLKRQFAKGVTLGGERSQRPILVTLPEGELSLGGGKRLGFPSLVIRPRDRVGIQGPNGSGKSTLIRRIVTELDEVGVKVAYIPQEMDAQGARDILKAVRTLPPDRLGRVMTLVRRLGSDPARLLQSLEPSPGELRKLLLAQCLEWEPQIVVLDEPTNHLDLPSVVCLEGALEGYQAALVMVSHDRAFLARLADSVWNIRPGQGSGWELEG